MAESKGSSTKRKARKGKKTYAAAGFDKTRFMAYDIFQYGRMPSGLVQRRKKERLL